MADDLSEPELTPAEPTEAGVRRTGSRGRQVNTIELAPERRRRGTTKAAESEKEPAAAAERPLGAPSLRLGDVPGALGRRYFTETVRGGAALAFYEGRGAKSPAFHDHGGRLSTDGLNPTVVRDLAAIAAHRGWTILQVRGEDDFRREIWMEARTLGLEVKGYKPRERDQQELQQRRAAQDRTLARTDPEPAAEASAERPARRDRSAPAPPDRADFEAGVSGSLVARGEAPYRRRPGEAQTPFIRLDRGDGRPIEVWGVGLPDALTRAGASVGDQVRVRRDGVDTVERRVQMRDPVSGELTRQEREVPRNRWLIEADRFRQATGAAAARDPALRGAQSHLAVLDAVIDRAVRDPESRARLHAEARRLIVDAIAQGKRFEAARVRETQPVLARDLAQAAVRDRDGPERVHRR